MRVKAVIAYDGSNFKGFQKQTKHNQTVANTIEALLRSLNIHTKLVASGRTDGGVHASWQVVHFELPDFWSDLHKLKAILNAKLFDRGIAFKRLQRVSRDFHARFGAKKRSYQYLIKANVSVFERNYFAAYEGFDPELLERALRCFEGTHDFTYFQKTGSNENQNNPVRTLYRAEVRRLGEYTICCFQAEGFLRTQIRLMAGFALEVAYGRLSLGQLRSQLAGETCIYKKPASPHGLYLSHVSY